MSEMNIGGDLVWKGAEKVKEIVQHELAKSVNQIIDHAEQHPIGLNVRTNIDGNLSNVGWGAAEKVKEIVQHELAKAVNQVIDHAEQHPIGLTIRTPDSLSLAATVATGEPIKLSSSYNIGFKLFGISIWSMDIKGATDLGAQP